MKFFPSKWEGLYKESILNRFPTDFDSHIFGMDPALVFLSSQPAPVHPRSEKVVDDDVVLLALVAALDATGGNLVDARVGGDHLVPVKKQ